MKIIPLWRVRFALGIVADGLRDKPICTYGPALHRGRYAISHNGGAHGH